MNEDKCPCEECISFAICYQRRNIECELLYRFLCEIDETKYTRFVGYIHGRGISVFKIYKRWVINTNIKTYEVKLTLDSSREEVKKIGGGAYLMLHTVPKRLYRSNPNESISS